MLPFERADLGRHLRQAGTRLFHDQRSKCLIKTVQTLNFRPSSGQHFLNRQWSISADSVPAAVLTCAVTHQVIRLSVSTKHEFAATDSTAYMLPRPRGLSGLEVDCILAEQVCVDTSTDATKILG